MIQTRTWCCALAGLCAGAGTAAAGVPDGYMYLGFVRSPGGFAEFFSITEVGVPGAVRVIVTSPGGVSEDLPFDENDDRFRLERGAIGMGPLLAGTGTAGPPDNSLWTVEVEFENGASSTYEFNAYFQDLVPGLPLPPLITFPGDGDVLIGSPDEIGWVELDPTPGVLEVIANISELDMPGGQTGSAVFVCSMLEGCFSLNPDSIAETIEVGPLFIPPGFYEALVEYIRVPLVEPHSSLITPMRHVDGALIDWGVPFDVPDGSFPDNTAIVVYQSVSFTQFEVLLKVGSCSEADLAKPYNVLDFSDVLAFLTAFAGMDPAADLAEPFGSFDFSDVIAFLTAFGAGCP